MMNKVSPGELICKADYPYGNVTYKVSIFKSLQPIHFEHSEVNEDGCFVVEYIEETLPSKNAVGGFKSFEDAINWANSQFGKLDWQYFDKR